MEPGVAGSAGAGAGAGGGGGAPSTDTGLAPAGRVVRLSHAQWENSVRDLLRLDAVSGLSASFPMEAQGAGFLFDNLSDALQVEQSLWGAYGNAAAALAQRVASSPSLLAGVAPVMTGSDSVRATPFVKEFGQRAFRRPLSDEEVQGYLALFADGVSAYDDSRGFAGGARIVIEAMLQSPHFLYRIETSTAIEGDHVVLSSWEIAQRLSYFLTNSMPDDALFEAARSGELATPEGVAHQVERLLGEPAAQGALAHFHDQLLNLPTYTGISPSPVLFPEVTSAFGKSVLASTRATLDDLVFGQHQGFAGLMTTTRTFVNAELAPVYGLAGDFGAELAPVDLPPEERRGLLTQAGFLAANATGINPDPIHRGVFIAKRILCRAIAAPPNNVTPLPPSGIGTNRQIVEEHTQSGPGCASCHESRINPYGFVFENYDAVGGFRTMDNELPVDASATPVLDGQFVSVDGALDFASALAVSREAHDCFARHLYEFALGRNAAAADKPMIESLGQASLDGDSIVGLVSTIASSPNFLQRSAEEAE